MKLSQIGFSFALLGCMSGAGKAVPARASHLAPVQLYLFNRSGKTADLKIALGDSVLYYAQVRTITLATEISGARLVERVPGTYRVVLNDFTHGQYVTRDIPVGGSGIYIVVTTRQEGSQLVVSTTRPF